MAVDATPDDRELTLPPLDEKVDHVRGSATGRLIIEYGDYECPYSRQAFHAISQVEQQLGGNMRFAFRHFPLTGPASRWQRGSAATLTAASLRARCLARRPCSSTASSTAAATTRPPCWPR
jgi:protein-disulfide isomerase